MWSVELTLVVVAVGLTLWYVRFRNRRDVFERLAHRRANELLQSTQEQTAQALRQSEGRIAAIVNAAVEGIITIDARGTIEFVNPAALKIFGYESAELIGQNVNLLMPEPYASRHEGYLGHYLATGQQKVIGIGREVEGRRKDGTTFPVDLSVSEVPAVGIDGMRRFAGIVRDVTARKEAEAKLVRLSAAEAANKAKDDFLAAVSHDLRTPVGAIMLLAEVMKRTQLTEKQERTINRIMECARTQSRLIEDILDSARILHGKLTVELSPMDLTSVAESAVGAVSPLAREQGVEIVIEATEPAGRVLPIRGESLRLQQVCWNLLNNAVKFSLRGSQIRVQMGQDESNVWLAVIDQGRGIAQEFLPHVFERLAQAEDSTTRRWGGLGLGLNIARHIVELHGGTIAAQSAGIGCGATFTVRLPRPKKEADLLPVPSLQGVRVLVVEDDAEMRDSLTMLLGVCGAQARSATSVDEGWGIFVQWCPHVLISDNTPLGADGLSLISKVRALPDDDGGNVRAIALAGEPLAASTGQSHDDEFDLFLSKPADPNELLAAIARLAGTRHERRLATVGPAVDAESSS